MSELERQQLPSALLQRLTEEDDTLLEGRGPQIDALLIERLYQYSWPVRYVPYPMLFGAFVLFNDYASWWSIIALTGLYTVATGYLDYQRQQFGNSPLRMSNGRHWGTRFAIGSAGTGLTWGLLVWMYFPPGNLALQAVMAVAWGGLAFSSLNTRSVHLPSYYAFLLAMSAPAYLRVFLSGERPAIYMVLLGSVLGTAMSLWAHNHNRRERLAMALRLHNAELIAELDRARASAEAGRSDIERSYRAVLGEFSAAQRLARHGSWTWEAADDLIAWSDEFYRLVGLAPQSCPAAMAGLLQQTHPDDHEILRGHFRRLRNGANRDQAIFRLRDSGGSKILAIGEAERDSMGRTLRVVGVIQPLAGSNRPSVDGKHLQQYPVGQALADTDT